MKITFQFAGGFGAGTGLADGMRWVAAQRAISTDNPEVHQT